VITFSSFGFSQDSTGVNVERIPKRLFVVVEAGYAQGVGRADVRDRREISIDNNGDLYRGRLVAGVIFNPKVSFGIGVGMESLYDPDFKTLPVTLDYRYYWKNGSSPFLNVMSGYSLKLNDSFFAGIYSSVNVGYRFSEKFPVLLSMGLDFHQIKNAKATYYLPSEDIVYVESSVWLYSFSVNVGIPLQR
jgi:hypothetical protein